MRYVRSVTWSRARAGAGAALALVAAAVGVTQWRASEDWAAGFDLPAEVRIVEGVANLSAAFDRSHVASEAADAPVHVGRLQPGLDLEVDGRHRRAIIAPPAAVIRFRVRAPAGTRLVFGAGVGGDRREAREARGLRFTAAANGRVLSSRTVNPATRKSDRRWFETEIDLGLGADAEVEISLATDAEDGVGPLAGVPGWAGVRLVRDIQRIRQTAGPRTPNVLLVLADTLRADRVGCYGAQPTRTPVLDALATEGLVFENAIAQSAWTLPSVASIFTGLHPRSHGVVGISDHAVATGVFDRQAGAPDPSSLSEALRTVAERAQDVGMTTIGISANPLVSRATSLGRGFENFVEFGYEGRHGPWRDGDEINRVFREWLRRNGRFRFFAYLHYMDVHGPYRPPESSRPPVPAGVRPNVARGEVAELARKINAGRDVRLTAVELEYLRALYDADVRAWDEKLGSLLATVDAAGVRDKTVVVVVSDHGEGFLEHGRLKHGVTLYDELLRVPLVIQGPGIGMGREAGLAQGIDLLPTIGAILGLAVDETLPGRNLLAHGLGGSAVSETGFGIGPDGGNTPLVSWRTREWKLIHTPALGRFELYDLARDPSERQNIYETAPQAAAFVDALAAWGTNASPAPASEEIDPDLGKKLRALGYID
jgi:arylsulfatase A-like enzyme